MNRLAATTLALAVALTVLPVAAADESFDAGAYDRKAFAWTGFIEARPERQWLRQDSAGYVIQYDKLPEPGFKTTDRFLTSGLQIVF